MSEFSQEIWNYLKSSIVNEYGVAGLMGNLQSESGLIPYRLQGDFTSGYRESLQYTNDVNLGVKSKNSFISDGKGYGLAQWTTQERKERFYNYYPLDVESIGSTRRNLSYLVYELQNYYGSVWNALINASSIRAASNAVLHDFERPAEQGTDVEIYRAGLGTDIYNEFSGGQPTPPTPPQPYPGPESPIPIWMLWAGTKRKI